MRHKLESFCSGTAGSAKSSLEEFYDSLEEIYKKHVIEFENTDDDYKGEAARVYDACTSAGERFWDIGTKIGKLVNDINDKIDAAVYDFVSGIFGLAFTLAKLSTKVDDVVAVTKVTGILDDVTDVTKTVDALDDAADITKVADKVDDVADIGKINKADRIKIDSWDYTPNDNCI